MAQHCVLFQLKGIEVHRVNLNAELVKIAGFYQKANRSVQEFAEDFIYPDGNFPVSFDRVYYHIAK